MPDPTRQSVSASQASALLNVSPYATRWLLWQAFKHPETVTLDTRPDKRMAWGNKLQSAILAATAEQYRLDCIENIENEYVRRGFLGCTRDGLMVEPSTGKIVVEAKTVDRDVFRHQWANGTVPPHIEIQVQVELYAEDASRAIIAVLVGGNDLKFLERRPNAEIRAGLLTEAELFFLSLERDEPPDASGSAVELPALAALYPVRPERKRFETVERAIGEQLRTLHWAQDQRAFATRLADQTKAKVLGLIGDAEIVTAPGAHAYVNTFAVNESRCECGRVNRKGYVATNIKVNVNDEDPPEPEEVSHAV